MVIRETDYIPGLTWGRSFLRRWDEEIKTAFPEGLDITRMRWVTAPNVDWMYRGWENFLLKYRFCDTNPKFVGLSNEEKKLREFTAEDPLLIWRPTRKGQLVFFDEVGTHLLDMTDDHDHHGSTRVIAPAAVGAPLAGTTMRGRGRRGQAAEGQGRGGRGTGVSWKKRAAEIATSKQAEIAALQAQVRELQAVQAGPLAP